MIKKSTEHTYEFKNPYKQSYSAVGYNWLIGFSNNYADYLWRTDDGEEFLTGIMDAFANIVHHEGGSAGSETSIAVSQDANVAIILLNNSRSGSSISFYLAMLMAFGSAFGMDDVPEYENMMASYKSVLLPPVIELDGEKKARFVGEYSKNFGSGQVETFSVSLDANSDIWVGTSMWDDDKYRAWPFSETKIGSGAFGYISFTLPESPRFPATTLTLDDYGYTFTRVDN